MAKKVQKRKPFVYYDTVWKNVGGGSSIPGDTKFCNVGRHKVVVSRGEYLNRYGNPVYTASVLGDDGQVRATSRSSGSATMVVSNA